MHIYIQCCKVGLGPALVCPVHWTALVCPVLQGGSVSETIDSIAKNYNYTIYAHINFENCF